ncbi:MAG: ribbon-helix-helix domain-containing protein [Phormidesmis sp.]
MAPKKRRSLDAQLAQRITSVTNPSSAEPVESTTPPPRATKSKANSRTGKKAISGFFEPEVSRQLKALAAIEGRTVQGMIGEALNLLFEKYGKDTIATDE